MLSKTIKYTDYKGQEREEEFFFDISPAEFTEMQFSEVGGMEAFIQKVIKTQDTPTLAKLFRELILKSYGEISADGREFIKDPERAKHFSYTPAFSILYMELATNDKAASDFVNGITPAEYFNALKEKQTATK